ncbi:MAG: hypothetical protein ABIH37_03140, partial [archaeon]
MITTNTNDSVVQKPIGSIVNYDETLKNRQKPDLARAFNESPIVTDYSQIKPLFEKTLAAIAEKYPDCPEEFSIDNKTVEIFQPSQVRDYDSYATFIGSNGNIIPLTARCDEHEKGKFKFSLEKAPRAFLLYQLAHELGHTLLQVRKGGVIIDQETGEPGIQEDQKAMTFQELCLREACLQGLPLEEALTVEQMLKPEGLIYDPENPPLKLLYKKNKLHHMARDRTRRMYQKLRTWEPQLKENEQELWPQMLDIASLDKLRSRSYKGRRKY